MAQNNEFKIGMFGATSCKTHIVNSCDIPFETPLDNGQKTSVLNVLAEDGFNICQTYAPNEWTSENFIKSYLKLSQANGFKVEVGAGHYYKPNVDANGNYLGSGTNVFDNCGNSIGACQTPYSQNYFRARINNFITNVYKATPYKDIIWGYHVCEEASYYHAYQFSNNCQGNVWMNPSYFKNVEIPTINVSNAISTLKTALEGFNHKMVVMEANHHKNINSNTNDGEGTYNPQSYLYLLNKNDARDVFFEGSYTQFPSSGWLNQVYSNMYNNGYHYLGPIKSIDFAKNYANEVHKVVNIEGTSSSSNYLYHYHSNLSIQNANWLWFQTYTSIIHGVKGIWFWDLNYSWNTGETNNWGNTNLSNRFDRSYFPSNYTNFTANLAKELRYLVNNIIISTDANTVIATKTDGLDPNCIVPAITSSAYQLYTSVPSEKKTENYSLRYTIRSNGTESYMIVTNPLNIPVTVTLNFSNASNQVIQSSTGVNVMFDNNQYSPTSSNYKVNRNSNINLANNTVGNQYYIAYSSNKQLTLSFGPMDVKVLRFISSPPNNNNGWDRAWSNYGSGNIDGHHVNDGDLFYTGDFDGDGSEELLCVGYTANGNSDWITVLKYINNDWEWLWSNYGSSSAGNGIYPYRNSFIAGDFDGDGKDELLGNILNGWTTMFKFNNGNWNWIWSDNGSSSHPIRPYKDKFYAGDFNGDGRDELFGCDLPDGWTTMFRWNGSNFAWYWSDNGSNHSIRPYRSNMIAGDFDGDGKAELLGFSSWATLFHFDNSNWQWGWSTYGTSSFNGWTYPIPSTDRILAGNLDSDLKDELFFLQTHSSAAWATTMDLKNDQSAWNWNWSANPQYSITFIDDWSLASNGGSNTKYYLVRAKTNESKYLLSMRKFCDNYLVNMYKPIGSSNKSTSIGTSENALTTESVTIESINDISVYPNPAQNTLTISMPNALQYRIEIIDLNGKKIKVLNNAEGLVNIDCLDINVGIYLLKVFSSEKIYQKKIVITK